MPQSRALDASLQCSLSTALCDHRSGINAKESLFSRNKDSIIPASTPDSVWYKHHQSYFQLGSFQNVKFSGICHRWHNMWFVKPQGGFIYPECIFACDLSHATLKESIYRHLSQGLSAELCHRLVLSVLSASAVYPFWFPWNEKSRKRKLCRNSSLPGRLIRINDQNACKVIDTWSPTENDNS